MQARIEPSEQEIEQFEKNIRDLYYRVLKTLTLSFENEKKETLSVQLLFSPEVGRMFQVYLEKTAMMPDPFVAASKLKAMCETFLLAFDEKTHKKNPKLKSKATRIERMDDAIKEIRAILTTHCTVTGTPGKWAEAKKDDIAELNISDPLRKEAIGWEALKFSTVENVFSEGIRKLFNVNQIPPFVSKLGAESLNFLYTQDAIDTAIHQALDIVQKCHNLPTLKSKLPHKGEKDFLEKLEEKLIRYSHLPHVTKKDVSKKEKKLRSLSDDFGHKIKKVKNLTPEESELLSVLQRNLWLTLTHARKSEHFTQSPLTTSSKHHRKNSNASNASMGSTDSSGESTHSNSRNAKTLNASSKMSVIDEESKHNTASIMKIFKPTSTSSSESHRSLTLSKASRMASSNSSQTTIEQNRPRALTPNAKKASQNLHNLFTPSTPQPSPTKTAAKNQRSKSHDMGKEDRSFGETAIGSMISLIPGGEADGGVGPSSPINKKKK